MTDRIHLTKHVSNGIKRTKNKKKSGCFCRQRGESDVPSNSLISLRTQPKK
jgi:hypothetical protein